MDLQAIDYERYVDELLEKLQMLVSIPSVYDPSSQSELAPYGQAIADALALVTQWAEDDGFKVTHCHGHAIVIELADTVTSGERLDLISHLDVVDVGAGWDYPAFAGLIEDGKMYGRGVNDMKRAVVLTYFLLRILRDYDIPLKHRLCLVYGTDEETNMSDLSHYLDVMGIPDFAITPDSTFPLSSGEKGATTWLIQGVVHESTQIVEIKGGVAANVVPSYCQVTVATKDYVPIQRYREQTGWDIEMAPVNAGIQISVRGRSAHASVPELGDNAILKALTLVRDLYQDPFATHLLSGFNASDGSGLGIACQSDLMGPLTINLGTLHLRDGQIRAQLDSRFPETTTSQAITEALQRFLPTDWQVSRPFDTPAIVYPLASPACQTLQNLFASHYPNHPQKATLSGGVTYSKVVPNCVAFGMNFADSPAVAHQPNEYIELDNLAELLAFYTETVVTLGNLETLKTS